MSDILEHGSLRHVRLIQQQPELTEELIEVPCFLISCLQVQISPLTVSELVS